MNIRVHENESNVGLFTISKTTLTLLLLYSSVLFLGLGFHLIYVSLLLLVTMQKPELVLKAKFRTSFITILILMTLFLIPQYIVGYHKITLDNPIISMLSVMFSVILYGLLLQQMEPKIIKNCIILLIIGIGFEALIIALYSFISDPSYYGYGRLYNPVLNRETNSPGAALKISILASVCVWYVFQKTSLIRKIGLVITVCALTLLATWLASRAYFVILGVSILASVILNLKLKNILRLSVFSVLGLFVFIYIFNSMDYSLFSKLYRLDGSLESARFMLLEEGLKNMSTHPFGGFSVDESLDNVKWFHNIFLDSARLAGWLPVLSLILLSTYAFVLFLDKRNSYSLFAGFIFAMVFLLMQQDVVVEAMIRFMVLIYFCAIFLGVRYKNGYSE